MLRQGVSYVERSCRACTLDFLRQHQTSLTVLRPFHTSLSNARRPGNASNNRGEPSNYAPKNGHGDRSARFGGRDGGRPGQRRPGRPGGSNKLPRETRPAPTLEQLRTTLGRRIGPWTSSEQTMKQLAAIGMEVEDSEILLMEFEAIASRSLDRSIFGTKLGASSSEYRVDWDVEGLSIALQHDADWSRAVERSYLRQFLKWVSREEVVTGQFTSILTSSTVLRIREILAATDLSHLSSQYTEAREMKRQFHLHIGPTNSGKTYNALKALATAKTGAYAGPLRLLAHEVWERLNRGTVGGLEEGKGRECNLITGEERRIVSLEAGLTSCTVECCP
jgi:ATP-dependent RNA helicase SUPV3L1/SUV3